MTLFDDLVSAIQPRLRSVAPFILTRLLLRAGIIDRGSMSAAEFRRVLPTVEAGLRESLSQSDFVPVMGAIEAVLARWETSQQSRAGESSALRT